MGLLLGEQPLRKLLLYLVFLGATPASASEPIEAYAALPTLHGWPCGFVPYAPVDVYDASDGHVLGQLVLDRPELVRESKSQCDDVPSVQLVIRDKVIPVAEGEWSYEARALVIYEQREAFTDQDKIWVRGQSESGPAFWALAPKQNVHSYEDLVWVPDDFRVVCLTPQTCAPADAAFLEAMAAADEAASSCSRRAYGIVDRVLSPAGMKLYQLQLDTDLARGDAKLAAKLKAQLPATIYIPRRTEGGQHTASFSARGC
jgi:hypothetical protein